jgi:hypothetical protein
LEVNGKITPLTKNEINTRLLDNEYREKKGIELRYTGRSMDNLPSRFKGKNTVEKK